MAYVLIVDDDDDVVGAVQRRLRRHGHETQAAYNGQQALQAIQERRPDLVILDIIMPGMDGIEVCRRLRADPSTDDISILFLTAKGKLEDKVAGFEAGADDYLTKPFEIQELELRVRALLRRSLWGRPGGMEAEPLVVGDLILDPRTFEVQVNDKRALLTPAEFELLYYLISHGEEVISSERLLQEVWRYPPGTGAPDLVRVHIKNIRDKIEPDPRRPQYIRTISRHGYTVREPRDQLRLGKHWDSGPPRWAKADFRIFLCHASEDKPKVRRLYQSLKDEGYSPWLDEEDILPGQDFDHEIRRAIRRTNVFLACLSTNSVHKRGYIQKEIVQALDVLDETPEGVIYLIPVRLEECNVPDRLGKQQWVDLFAPDGFERLVQAIEWARVIRTET